MVPGTTALQAKLARQILSLARSSGWASGHHLTEDWLQATLGTSRTPIRGAMAHLETLGVLEKRPNRGFFLKALPPAEAAPEEDREEDRIHLAIALDRVNRRLPDLVSENELIRRYPISRPRLRHVLARIAAEGWIERRQGRGWAFQPLIDTVEAYRENYRFRQMIEPAAIRAPEFRPDAVVLARLEAQQRFVRDRGFETLGQVELFEINAQFHQGIAGMSGNRFILQTLERLNQLRRLVEYGRPLDRRRVRRVCREHLAILAALAEGDAETAARRVERHLRDAAGEKASAALPVAG